MQRTRAEIDRLEAAALQQPGAKRRHHGIKFQCAGCAAEGHDEHRDNACLFTNGDWGCAWSKDMPVGRAHWEAIGLALGASKGNGHLPRAPVSEESDREPAPAAAWPAHEPVPSERPTVPVFDASRLLPAGVAPWVADVAERAQCPADYVGVGVVVAAASVVGRQLTIRPKRHDDWAVVPNLWGIVIGPPGVMKTAGMQEALRPIRALVADAREAYARAREAHVFAVAEAKAKQAAVSKQLKTAAATGAPTDVLRDAFQAAKEPPEPVERRYLVNDATVEKLGEILNKNRNGVLLFRDELAGWLRTMERQGHENDRSFYCEAWNGTGSYTYDRIGRGTLHIEAACVSVLGGIQPMPLGAYLQETFAAGQDDGLIQRAQLLVFPDVAQAWVNVDRLPDSDARRRAVDLFRSLDRLDYEALGAHAEGLERPFLRFTPEAQACFNAWRADLERRVRSADEHPAFVSHLAKYRSLVPSLALIFHLLDCADRGIGGFVSLEATERALAWAAYLEPHARRVYDPITAPGRAAAASLARKIAAGALPSPFTAREVRRKGWAGLTEPADILAGLDVLEGLHWVRRESVRSGEQGGRPTVQWRINPAVRSATR
jgi:Protein of unknown function (DUF3987)